MRSLSQRGQRLLTDSPRSPYVVAHQQRDDDRYDPVTNPDGYIGLCVAENKQVWDLIGPRLQAARPDLPAEAAGYDRMIGAGVFRSQLADFMERHIHGRRFEPDQIAVLAGAGTVLEILFHCLSDPEDAVLVPTPGYSGFWPDLETRDELTLVPVHTRSDDGFTLTEHLLDAAFEASPRPVRALLYTNPHNPTGAIASRQELQMVIDWAQRRSIHLVVDELYALSIHGAEEFVSAAQMRPHLGDGIHLVWAFSKDFAASGLRCGVLVTENDEVMAAVESLAYWGAVSGDTQHVLGEMVADAEWAQEYVTTMQAGLRDSYTEVTAALDAAGIRYVPASGGFFFLLDLREHLDAPTWEAEHALWLRLLDDANVNLTPGSACHIGEPGFMRLCFATDTRQAVMTGVERLIRVLG